MGPRKKMKLTGFDWDDTTPPGRIGDTPIDDLAHEMPYSDNRNPGGTPPLKFIGMPITVNAFNNMVNLYRSSGYKGLTNVWWVDFSKASVLRILSQERCEAIRFNFCLPFGNVENISLSMQGLNRKMHPIKEQAFLSPAAQVNKGRRRPRSTDPNLEERGNGGGGQFAFRVADLFQGIDEEELKKMLLTEFLDKLFKGQADQYAPDDNPEGQNWDEEDK